jgi:polygalacturonase
VRPEHLGATGSGDEYAVLQQWANLLGGGGDGQIDGAHQLGAQIVLSGRRNFKIAGNGQLAMGNGAPVAVGYSALVFKNCSDFQFSGVTIDGNRGSRRPKEVMAHNIQFQSCHNFKVENVASLNAVCDGFYIASPTPTDVSSHCSDFTFEDCRAEKCSRQGMSIIQGHRGTIRNCTFSNTHGISPQAGIDLESNPGNPVGSIDTITIEGCLFVNNKGYGFQVFHLAHPGDIELQSCTFQNNGRGPILWGAKSGTVSDCRFAGATKANVITTSGARGEARFRLVRPKIG